MYMETMERDFHEKVSAKVRLSAEGDATIALLQFEKWGILFRSLAICEDQEAVNRKVLARFSDVCEKQFSSLTTNRGRIHRFLSEFIA